MAKYQDYKDLESSKKEIRVLKLLAAIHPDAADSEVADSTISCSLETVELHNANPFYALSYVWGPAEPIAPLNVDGRNIFIRMNLWKFLFMLRSRFCRQAKDTIRIWADYICIQQTNLAELSAQVSIMGDIYRAADAVYAWLGDPVLMDRDDVQCVESVCDSRQQAQSWSKLGRDEGSDLRNLASSEYWTRLWIKQEVILSKDIWFFYGQDVVHWKDLRFATILNQERSRFPQPRRRTSSMGDEQPRSDSMTSLLNLRALRSDYDELPDLVSRFRDAQCQDERDRVYALLALTDPTTRSRVTVDYQQPLFDMLLTTFPHWSSDQATWLGSGKNERSISVHSHQSFIAQMSTMLSPAKLYSIHQKKDLATGIAARIIFMTSALAEVIKVQTIATIHDGDSGPVLEVPKPEAQSYILKTFVRMPRPGQPRYQRGYLVYADARPRKGDMLGRIGNHMIFMRKQNSGQLRLEAFGTEAAAMASVHPTNGQHLSTQLFQHPCRWRRYRMSGACCKLVVEGSNAERQGRNRLGVGVSYNAEAVMMLLVDSNAFPRDDLAEDDPDDDTNIPHVWSPYVFGVQNHILDSCPSCRRLRRGHSGDEATGEVSEECSCKWTVD